MVGALGLGSLLLLLTAAWLTPDASGRGTHQQLGLPPCTMIFLFGTPCPSCGMTTSWAHFVRGEIVASLRANAGGTLLAMVAVVVAAISSITAVAGRWIVPPPGQLVCLLAALGIVAVTLVDWLVRIGVLSGSLALG